MGLWFYRKVCWSILTPRVMVLGWWSSRLMEFQVDEEGRGLVDACVIPRAYRPTKRGEGMQLRICL